MVARQARPRLVLIHSSDELYGADRMLIHVATALQERLDVDVEVWLPNDVEHGPFPLCEELTANSISWQHKALPIMRRAYVRPLGLIKLARVAASHWRELRRVRPDLVYLSSSACLVSAPVARGARVPRRMLHVQERWLGKTAKILAALARSTTARLSISNYVDAATGLDDPPAVVVVNCVDDARLRAEPRRVEADAPLRFLIASRWNDWKGHTTLVNAWELAGCPGELTVLGGPPPMGVGVDVEALVDETVTRPESVNIVGEVHDIAPYLAESDVLVLPSDSPEPFGLVAIEAFSMGLPVIASRAGGPLEIVDPDRTGWFYNLADAADLASVLSRLDRATVEAAGRAARVAFDEQFSPDRYHEHVAQLIGEHLADH